MAPPAPAGAGGLFRGSSGGSAGGKAPLGGEALQGGARGVPPSSGSSTPSVGSSAAVGTNERLAQPAAFEAAFDTSSPYFVSDVWAARQSVCACMEAWLQPQVSGQCQPLAAPCMAPPAGACMCTSGHASCRPVQQFKLIHAVLRCAATQGKSNPFGDKQFEEFNPLRAHRRPPPPPPTPLRDSPSK